MEQAKDTTAKSININLRIAPAQRELIDRAAQSLGKSRTEFILDVATREAEQTLLDKRLFVLDETEWNAFVATLDAPVSPNPQLRRVLTTSAPWELSHE
jgi:uncharacterized protein (DUF1778 family)